ncbi:MAG: transposase [Gammaproteobacteria bacterium]|nr:transposase [Gammaproteobacteria bacterium]
MSNYIHNLPVTRVWDLEEKVIIGDADGQKFETSRHTLQSRYSSKYFGTYKVTGDNNSINQINFVILDAINVAFIPGIKDIPSEAEKLYCVGDPSQYTGLIKPKGQIDTALIKSEKRGIIRVLLSLILQKNTQAIIVKKLSSHKRYSRLRNALWEYNKILKSTHVLNLIDDIQLRQTIRSGRPQPYRILSPTTSHHP